MWLVSLGDVALVMRSAVIPSCKVLRLPHLSRYRISG